VAVGCHGRLILVAGSRWGGARQTGPVVFLEVARACGGPSPPLAHWKRPAGRRDEPSTHFYQYSYSPGSHMHRHEHVFLVPNTTRTTSESSYSLTRNAWRRKRETHPGAARVFLGQVSPVTINTSRYTHLQLACIIPFRKAPEA